MRMRAMRSAGRSAQRVLAALLYPRPVDENGTPALVYVNLEVGVFWYANQLYPTLAAMLAGMGAAGQDNGDGTVTIGPTGGGQPFPGYNASAGTIVCRWISTSQTQSQVISTVQATSNANYWRLLNLDGSNRPAMQVNNGSVAQASIFGPAGAIEQTNRIFQCCSVMATNDFSHHVDGEPIGIDTSGLVSGVSVGVSVQIGHRAGANKLIGTTFSWAYFPRAVSMEQRRKLSAPADIVAPGAWTFFSSPVATGVGSGIDQDILVGGVTPQFGSAVVARPGTAPIYLRTALQRDDHNNPGVLRLANGSIVAAYCRHALDDNYYIRRSLDGGVTWTAEVDIGIALGGGHYTYANLVEINSGLYLFLRSDVPDDSYYTWHYAVSLDGGATFSAAQQLWAEPGMRSYSQFIRGGPDRIDAICNDGHPNEFVGNSTYHAYFQSGLWYKTDGTPLGAPPFRPATSLTRIWDGTGGQESWVWDIQWDGTERAAVFATFPDPAFDHRYKYVRWVTGVPVVTEICGGGGSFDIAGGDVDEKYYSGGVSIDPDDVNIVYCSIEVGTGGLHRNGGTFQVFKAVTANLGGSFSLTQLTFGQEDCFRPHKVKGTNKLVFCKGNYVDYRDTSCRIVMMTV